MQALAAPSAFALQRPDWQTMEPFATVHGPSPSAKPHLPFGEQTSDSHARATWHEVVFAAPHVFVTGLHPRVAHTAAARLLEQIPLWRPSLGSASPAALSATQRRLERWHHASAAQSAST